MKTKDFLQSLRALGCEVGSPDRSFVREYLRQKALADEIAKIEYRDEGREMGARRINSVRKKLGLTPENGVYEAEFFQLEPTVDVVTYAGVLDRLADA